MCKFFIGHSSVNTLKLLCANLETVGRVRSAFSGHEAFNVHHTSHHTEEDPFPDQLKGMWFCTHKKFFRPDNDCSTVNVISDTCGETGILPARLFDVYGKGNEKVKLKFGRKLFDIFHVMSESNHAGDKDEETLSDCGAP